ELVYDGQRATQICEDFDPPAIGPIVVTHGRVLLVVRCKRDWRTRTKHSSGRGRSDHFARRQSWARSSKSHRAVVVRSSCLWRDGLRLLSFDSRVNAFCFEPRAKLLGLFTRKLAADK